MSDQAKTTTDSLRLAKYVVLLVLDDMRLDDYVNNPGAREEEMRAAKLSDKEIDLLSADGVVELCTYLKEARVAPVPHEEGSGGGGG